MCERTYHGKANAVRRRSQLPRKCQSFGHRHSIHYIALSSCAVCVLDLYACVQLKMQRKKEPLLRSQLTDVWLSVCCVVLSYHCLRCSFHPMHAVFMWNFFPFSILLLLQLCVLAAPRRANCKEHRRSQCVFFLSVGQTFFCSNLCKFLCGFRSTVRISLSLFFHVPFVRLLAC